VVSRLKNKKHISRRRTIWEEEGDQWEGRVRTRVIEWGQERVIEWGQERVIEGGQERVIEGEQDQCTLYMYENVMMKLIKNVQKHQVKIQLL
jgi:hypothetical protein